MLKYFLKHFGQALLFVFAIFGFAWVGIQIGNFVGGQMQNDAWGHIVAMGFIFLVGIIYYAYSQAKMDVKYRSK
jgi:hypothetical protein